MNWNQLFIGTTLIELLMRIVFLLIGAIIMFVIFPMFGALTRIMYCRERDGRGMDLAVNREDEIGLETKNKLRFFKYGRSYTFTGFMNRVKNIFFGKEGTAYTWSLSGFSGVAKYEEQEVEEKYKDGRGKEKTRKVKKMVNIGTENAKIELEFDTLWDAIKFKLGDAFLRPFPKDKRDILMEDKLLVTVGLEPGLTPEGYSPATEQDIENKAKRDMANVLATGVRNSLVGGFIDRVPWIGMGVALGIVGAIALGWIPVGA